MHKYRPWLPVTVLDRDSADQPMTDIELRESDVTALRAVNEGIANADQQKRAMLAILHVCGVNDSEYLPEEHGGVRDSAFKSGKRHVGLQVRKLISLPLTLLTGENNERSKGGTTGKRRTRSK